MASDRDGRSRLLGPPIINAFQISGRHPYLQGGFPWGHPGGFSLEVREICEQKAYGDS